MVFNGNSRGNIKASLTLEFPKVESILYFDVSKLAFLILCPKNVLVKQRLRYIQSRIAFACSLS